MENTKHLFVATKNVLTNTWVPVGKLSLENGMYAFRYTNGARSYSNFVPFGHMKDINKVYRSSELFSFFKNRILSSSRSNYEDYLNWMNVTSDNDPLDILAISGGERGTDNIEIFPIPIHSKKEKYEITFFAHGVRHLCQGCQQALDNIKPSVRLFLCKDVQNGFDKNAWFLRSETPFSFVGYVPRFFTNDIETILNSVKDVQNINVEVVRINADAPAQFRLLCKLEAPWVDGFEPFSGFDFQPIVND